MTTFAWAPSPFGGTTVLSSPANWSSVTPNAIPTAADSLVFNSRPGTLTGAVQILNADFSLGAWNLLEAQLTLGGLLTVSAGATLSGSGTVTGTITDNGTIKASGGLLTLSGPIGGTGLLQIAAGATLDVTSTSAGETISFLAAPPAPWAAP